jgi:hypothetical protein
MRAFIAGAHFLYPFFTYLSVEMSASGSVASAPVLASAPIASAPIASAPIASAPVASQKNHIIDGLRELFCKFKAPYLEEKDGDETNTSLQNIDDVEESAQHIDKLFMLVSQFIDAKGAPPVTTDVNILSVYKVFEPFMKELQANPSLRDEMMHYAKLDLRTYPFTISNRHINQLERNGIQSLTRIIPNTETNDNTRK